MGFFFYRFVQRCVLYPHNKHYLWGSLSPSEAGGLRSPLLCSSAHHEGMRRVDREDRSHNIQMPLRKHISYIVLTRQMTVWSNQNHDDRLKCFFCRKQQRGGEQQKNTQKKQGSLKVFRLHSRAPRGSHTSLWLGKPRKPFMWAIWKKKEKPSLRAHPVWYAVQSKATCPAQPLIKCTRSRLTPEQLCSKVSAEVIKIDPLFFFLKVVCEESKCLFVDTSAGSVCV